MVFSFCFALFLVGFAFVGVVSRGESVHVLCFFLGGKERGGCYTGNKVYTASNRSKYPKRVKRKEQRQGKKKRKEERTKCKTRSKEEGESKRKKQRNAEKRQRCI